MPFKKILLLPIHFAFICAKVLLLSGFSILEQRLDPAQRSVISISERHSVVLSRPSATTLARVSIATHTVIDSASVKTPTLQPKRALGMGVSMTSTSVTLTQSQK